MFGHTCEDCGGSLTTYDDGASVCIECRALREIEEVITSDGEPAGPVLSATARRIHEALAAVLSRDLGDQGCEVADLLAAVRDAAGEAVEPFLGSLSDRAMWAWWVPLVDRAGDLVAVSSRALAVLLRDAPPVRTLVPASPAMVALCEMAAETWLAADVALAEAHDLSVVAPDRVRVFLLTAHHALATVGGYLTVARHMIADAGEQSPQSMFGARTLTLDCRSCHAEFDVVVARSLGKRPSTCPACRLRDAVDDTSLPAPRVRDLARMLRARGDGLTAADVDAAYRLMGIADLFAHTLRAPEIDGTLVGGDALFSRPDRGGRAGRPTAARHHGAHASGAPRPPDRGIDEMAYLTGAGRDRLWILAFEDEGVAVDVAGKRAAVGDTVASAFLAEHAEVRSLTLPRHAAFGDAGGTHTPSLMQRLVAVRLRRDRRIGLWSGTGTGKTLAAILGSAVCEVPLTVVLCPNSTVDGWRREIRAAIPDARIAVKASTPPIPTGQQRFMILNWEHLQDATRASMLARALRRDPASLVVLDEIHAAKQRDDSVLSLRRERTAALLAGLDDIQRGRLRVLGMTATPVVNALREGRALLELIEGDGRPDLLDEPTARNCLALHRALRLRGLRYAPDRPATEIVRHPEVDGSAHLRAFLSLPTGARTVPSLERLLVRAKTPAILSAVRRGTVVYTALVEGVVPQLAHAIARQGFRVGLCTGEDKSGLAGFLAGDLDVLIGTSAMATGLDGLQFVADRLVIAVPPWTAAEMHQLTGRVNRTGQLARTVEVVHPIASVAIDGVPWSWCRRRLDLIAHKAMLADAAVDGAVLGIDAAAAERLLFSALAELDGIMGVRHAA